MARILEQVQHITTQHITTTQSSTIRLQFVYPGRGVNAKKRKIMSDGVEMRYEMRYEIM